MSPALSFEIERNQRSNGVFVSATILCSIRSVYIMRECMHAEKVVNIFWFVSSVSSQYHSIFLANFTPENVSQVPTKEWRTTFFIYKINLIFMNSSWYFNSDAVLTVIVSFLNGSLRGFNDVRNGKLQTSFQIVKLGRLWKFCIKKPDFSFCDFLVPWRVGYFRNCNLPMTLTIQLHRWKVCKRAEFIVWKKLCWCIRNQLDCKRFHCQMTLINSFW